MMTGSNKQQFSTPSHSIYSTSNNIKDHNHYVVYCASNSITLRINSNDWGHWLEYHEKGRVITSPVQWAWLTHKNKIRRERGLDEITDQQL